MKYLMIIEKSDNGFCAYSPDISRCIAAESEEETKTLIKEAIVFHLESITKDGEELPKGQTIAEYVEIAA